MAKAKAEWNGETIAETDRAVLVEGNLYFPPDSVKREYLNDSDRKYHCPWKGEAGYYNLSVKGKANKDAAWYYYETYPAADKIKNYVAFDRSLGVKTEGTAADKIPTTPHP
ncbi:MAG: DUF427 domain-containing protein [Dehalococcoidia bacterium]|jgi:uncharacterized protein (DUF427 family)